MLKITDGYQRLRKTTKGLGAAQVSVFVAAQFFFCSDENTRACFTGTKVRLTPSRVRLHCRFRKRGTEYVSE
jgi:hypothetical protein